MLTLRDMAWNRVKRKGIASSTMQIIVLLVLGVLFVSLVLTVLSERIPGYFGEVEGMADPYLQSAQ